MINPRSYKSKKDAENIIYDVEGDVEKIISYSNPGTFIGQKAIFKFQQGLGREKIRLNSVIFGKNT